MRSSRTGVVVLLAVVLTSGTAGATSSGSSSWREVRGAFLAPIPCLFTKIHPVTGSFTCASVEYWDGVLNGVNRYTATGTFDLVSGDVHGTVDEVFTGVALPDRSRGTLHFAATFSVDGATNAQHVDAHIIGSGGGFRRFEGRGFLRRRVDQRLGRRGRLQRGVVRLPKELLTTIERGESIEPEDRRITAHAGVGSVEWGGEHARPQ